MNKHRSSGADITVAALPAAEKEAQAFGLMKIDDSGRITDFAEKPKGDALKAMKVDTTVLGLDAERSGLKLERKLSDLDLTLLALPKKTISHERMSR